jgi:phosphoenolpyruvate carboxykinase (GTP)
VETPIGRIPAEGELDLDGVDISDEQVAELFAVNADSWLAETDLTEDYYAKFGDRVPQALRDQLDALRSRLQSA